MQLLHLLVLRRRRWAWLVHRPVVLVVHYPTSQGLKRAAAQP